jgi:hypothetical protein
MLCRRKSASTFSNDVGRRAVKADLLLIVGEVGVVPACQHNAAVPVYQSRDRLQYLRDGIFWARRNDDAMGRAHDDPLLSRPAEDLEIQATAG